MTAFRRCLILLLGSFALASHAAGDPETPTMGMGIECLPKNLPPPGADATTDAQLKAMQNAAKFGGLAPPDFHRETWDLEGHSQFIHYEAATTLVPKGAILSVPKKYKDNIVTAVQGDLLVWTDFLAKYRGVVTFFDVDMQQAMGAKPLDATKFKAACATGRIVVAVCNHNPISMAPHPEVANIAADAANH